MQEYPWIVTEKHFFGRPGSDFDFEAHDVDAAFQELQGAQDSQQRLANRVNRKVGHKGCQHLAWLAVKVTSSTPATAVGVLGCSPVRWCSPELLRHSANGVAYSVMVVKHPGCVWPCMSMNYRSRWTVKRASSTCGEAHEKSQVLNHTLCNVAQYKQNRRAAPPAEFVFWLAGHSDV